MRGGVALSVTENVAISISPAMPAPGVPPIAPVAELVTDSQLPVFGVHDVIVHVCAPVAPVVARVVEYATLCVAFGSGEVVETK